MGLIADGNLIVKPKENILEQLAERVGIDKAMQILKLYEEG